MWNQSDSARFRQYHQQTGGRLLSHLRSQVPILTGTTIEQVALEAKHKEGAEYILRILEGILSEQLQADDSSAGAFTSM